MTIDDRLSAQDAPTMRVPPAETLTCGTEHLTLCAEALDCGLLTVTRCTDDEPSPYAVFDPENGDILGAGDSPDEAAEQAWYTVRGWK